MQEALDKLVITRLVSNPNVVAYLTESKMPLDEAVKQVLSDQHKSLTLEQYKDIVDGKYNCNWSETGCIMYFARPQTGRLGRSHTHCGEGEKDVCSWCITTLEGKKLASKLSAGLTREMYRLQKEKLRLTIAMSKLRLLDEKLLKLSTGRKPIWGFEYEHDERYGYHGPTGLVFQKRVVRGIQDNYTVGIDENNSGKIRKITLDDLPKLTGFNIIRDTDSMEERAARYVTRNLSRKESAK